MPLVNFDYRNWKGEVDYRRVDARQLEFITKPGFGYQPGWFLSGYDLNKHAWRSFSLSHIFLPEAAERFTIALSPKAGATAEPIEADVLHGQLARVRELLTAMYRTSMDEFGLDPGVKQWEEFARQILKEITV